MSIPNHIIPHLFAFKKHGRTRRAKLLLWSARCCAINAESYPEQSPERNRFETLAAELGDACRFAPHLPLTFKKA